MLKAHRDRLNSPLVRLAKAIAPGIIVILLLEVILRLGAFFWFDYSQYYLFYGFHGLVGRVGVRPSWTDTGKHYKFPPNYVLQGASGQASEKASINSLGFRGPEFQAVKPPGVFRIICMGESSTFGFRNSDTGTYPFQLEELFRKHHEGTRIEVINAGFPYYNSSSMLSLLKEEVLDYNPDVITLYNAFNDAGWPLEVGGFSRAIIWVQQHSIIYSLMKNYIIHDRYVYKIQKSLGRFLPPRIDNTEVENQLTRTAIRYHENVREIITLAKSRDIPIILIKQPMTTTEKRLLSLSYEGEYNTILTRVHEKNYFTPNEMQFVEHHRLIDELEKIAEEEHLPIVDNIAIVDQDRRRLASWVHLTEEGNLRLAEALKSAIDPYIEQKFAARRRYELASDPHK